MNTPLHLVVFKQPDAPAKDETINLLLQHGAHVDAANTKGERPNMFQ